MIEPTKPKPEPKFGMAMGAYKGAIEGYSKKAIPYKTGGEKKKPSPIKTGGDKIKPEAYKAYILARGKS